MKKKVVVLVAVVMMVAMLSSCVTATAVPTTSASSVAATESVSPTTAQTESATQAAAAGAYQYDSSTWGKGNPTSAKELPGVIQMGPATNTPCSLNFGDILPVADGPIGDPSRTYTIGLSLPMSTNIWWMGITDTMMLEAQKHSNIKLVVLNANGDAAQQANDIEALTVQKVDAIIVDPIQEDALVPAMKAAKAKGFLVLGVDREFSNKDAYVSQVTGDWEQGPTDLAQWSVDYLTKKYGEPKGIIAEIQTDMGSTAQLTRYNSFKNVIDKYPNITVVGLQSGGADQAKAYSVMSDIAAANPKIDIVYAHSEAMIMGAYESMAALKRTDGVAFIAVDVSKEGVSWIKQGKIQALAPWTPYMGDVALRLAIYALEGKAIPHQVWLPAQPLVTMDNVDTMFGPAYGPVPKGYESLWTVGKTPGQ